jgi:hypothetical protein
MVIDPATLSYIQTVIQTAGIVKISNIIIEPGRVRAMDDGRTVVMFQDKNVPDMPFGSIGINRIDVFTSRVDIAKSVKDFSITATVDTNSSGESFVRALSMNGKGIKIDYRCANPAAVQAPKVINDVDVYRVKVSDDLVSLMNKGMVAMKSDTVTFTGTKDGVAMEISDISSDVLRYHFADDIENLVSTSDDELPAFTYQYPIKTVIDLLKASQDGHVMLTGKGMMKINVNGLTMHVLKKELT